MRNLLPTPVRPLLPPPHTQMGSPHSGLSLSLYKALLAATRLLGSFTKGHTDPLEMEMGVMFSSFQAVNSVLRTLTPKSLPGR